MTDAAVCTGCGEAIQADERYCPRCGVTAMWRPGARGTAATRTPPAPSAAWERVLERLRDATAGDYDILRELGRGGMAAVYLAREVRLSRLVALKVMSPALLMDDEMVDRFRQEAVTLANVNHPNIVPIFTVQELDDLDFFVMKFIEGRGLDALIQEVGQFPIDMVRALLFEVGSALAAAHRRGIIHRDVKPANILVDVDGNAIVTDFGIAKVAERPGLTATGATVGTPAYMSPEQCLGAEVTGASDQYSLGIVAYELLTGRAPFGGSTLVVMRAHIETLPRSIRDLRPDCPEELETAIMRMVSKTAAERWPSLTQALAAAGAVAVSEESPVQLALAELASRGVTRIPPDIAATPPRTTPSARGARSRAAGSSRATPPRPDGGGKRRAWWLAVPASALAIAAIWALLPTRHPTVPPAVPDTTPMSTVVAPPPAPAPQQPSSASAPAPAAVAAAAVHIARLDSAARTLHFGEQRTLHVLRGVPVRWSSSRPEVAEVNGRTGVVIAGRTAGRAWIVAAGTAVADSVQMIVSATTTVAAADAPSTRAPVAPPPVASAATSEPTLPPPLPPPPAVNPPAIKGAASGPDGVAVSHLVEACLGAFNSRDPASIMRAYNPRDDIDQQNLRSLLKAATGARFAAGLSSKAAPALTDLGGGTMSLIFWATFQVSGNFAVGSGTRGPFAFALELHRTDGKWSSNGCRSTGTLKL